MKRADSNIGRQQADPRGTGDRLVTAQGDSGSQHNRLWKRTNVRVEDEKSKPVKVIL